MWPAGKARVFGRRRSRTPLQFVSESRSARKIQSCEMYNSLYTCRNRLIGNVGRTQHFGAHRWRNCVAGPGRGKANKRKHNALRALLVIGKCWCVSTKQKRLLKYTAQCEQWQDPWLSRIQSDTAMVTQDPSCRQPVTYPGKDTSQEGKSAGSR